MNLINALISIPILIASTSLLIFIVDRYFYDGLVRYRQPWLNTHWQRQCFSNKVSSMIFIFMTFIFSSMIMSPVVDFWVCMCDGTIGEKCTVENRIDLDINARIFLVVYSLLVGLPALYLSHRTNKD